MSWVVSQNTTIQATIDKRLLKMFEHGTVVEGMTYKLTRFVLGFNNYQHKVTGHKCRIYFDGETSVKKIEDSSIPRNKFNMVPFSDVIHHNVDLNSYIGIQITELLNIP